MENNNINQADTVVQKNTRISEPQYTKFSFVHDAKAIVAKEYPPVSFLIPGLIPASGLTLFAGASKAGKSWFNLQCLLSLCSENSTEFMGSYLSGGVEALYLALEDSEGRIKTRIQKIGIPATKHLHIATLWRHNEQGVQDIDEYITLYPQIKVVVIDTKGVFGIGRSTEETFQNDYAWMKSLKEVADKKHIAIILVTHLRKMPAITDEFDAITGSTANMAAADTIIMLKRPRQELEGTLLCTSRDFQETTIPILFSEETCTWSKLVHSTMKAKTKERQRLLDALREYGPELSPLQLRTYYPSSSKNISNLLTQMFKEGLVEHGSKRGIWKLTGDLKTGFPEGEQYE